MRYAIALAAIPVPLLMWGLPALPPPIAVTAVMTEGVRAQRQDDATFRARWSVVSDLPPAVVRQEGGDAPLRETASKPADVPAMTRPPARLVRRAGLRSPMDVCARHRMHRVTYGRRWRCRR